ncbi:mrna processing [Cystoisospora suis]|uniref:Mrna processing n=1 Tax=Cystoisospora suis TaxID=483139 RepID=A0A2C6KY19_9APIC|nr:mrna processing [Cystoisospora suis]
MMSRSIERGGGGGGGANQMWLGNIPFDATEDELRSLLSQVGRVLQVRVKYDDKGQSKGFAFCEFPDHETCHLAYQTLNNAEFRGRKLKIDYATDELRERYSHHVHNTPGGGGGGSFNSSSNFNSSSSSSSSSTRHHHHHRSSSSSSAGPGGGGGESSGGGGRRGGQQQSQQQQHSYSMKGEDLSSSFDALKGRLLAHAGNHPTMTTAGLLGKGGGGGQQHQQQGSSSQSGLPLLGANGSFVNKQGVSDGGGGLVGGGGNGLLFSSSLSSSSYHDSTSAAIDIMEIVQTFSTRQLIQFLSDMKKLAKDSPAGCRRLLEVHPALVYATLHATFLLGGIGGDSDKSSSRSSRRQIGEEESLKNRKIEKESEKRGGGSSVYTTGEGGEKYGGDAFSVVDERRGREASCSPPPEKKPKFHEEGVDGVKPSDFDAGVRWQRSGKDLSHPVEEGKMTAVGGGVEELEKRLFLPTAQLEQARRNRLERQQQLETTLIHPHVSAKVEGAGEERKEEIGDEDDEASYQRQTQLSSLSSTTSQPPTDKEDNHISKDLSVTSSSKGQDMSSSFNQESSRSVHTTSLLGEYTPGRIFPPRTTPLSSSTSSTATQAHMLPQYGEGQVVGTPTPVPSAETGHLSLSSESLQQQQGNPQQSQGLISTTSQQGDGLGLQAYQGIPSTTTTTTTTMMTTSTTMMTMAPSHSGSTSHVGGGIAGVSGGLGERMSGVEGVVARQQRILASSSQISFPSQKEGEEGIRMDASKIEERLSTTAVTIASPASPPTSLVGGHLSSSSINVPSSGSLPSHSAGSAPIAPQQQQQLPPWAVGNTGGSVVATNLSYLRGGGEGESEEGSRRLSIQRSISSERGLIPLPHQQEGSGGAVPARGQKESGSSDVRMIGGEEISQQRPFSSKGLVQPSSSSFHILQQQSSSLRHHPAQEQSLLQGQQPSPTKSNSSAQVGEGGGREKQLQQQPQEIFKATTNPFQSSSPLSPLPASKNLSLQKGVGEGGLPPQQAASIVSSTIGSRGGGGIGEGPPPFQGINSSGGGVVVSEERKLLISQQQKLMKTSVGPQVKDPALIKQAQPVSIEFPATGRGMSSGQIGGGVLGTSGSIQAENAPRQIPQKHQAGADRGVGGGASGRVGQVLPMSSSQVSGDHTSSLTGGGERERKIGVTPVGGATRTTPSPKIASTSEGPLPNAAVSGGGGVGQISGVHRGGMIGGGLLNSNSSTIHQPTQDMLGDNSVAMSTVRSNGVVNTALHTSTTSSSVGSSASLTSEDSFPTKLPRNQQRLSSLIQQGGLITPSKRPSSGNNSSTSRASSSGSIGGGVSPPSVTHQTPTSTSASTSIQPSGGISPYRAASHSHLGAGASRAGEGASSISGGGKAATAGGSTITNSSVSTSGMTSQAVLGGSQQPRGTQAQAMMTGGVGGSPPASQQRRSAVKSTAMSGAGGGQQHQQHPSAQSSSTSTGRSTTMSHVNSGSMVMMIGHSNHKGNQDHKGLLGRPPSGVAGIAGQSPQQHQAGHMSSSSTGTSPSVAVQGGGGGEVVSRGSLSNQRRGSGLTSIAGGQSGSPSSSSNQAHHIHGVMMMNHENTPQHAQQASNVVGSGGGGGTLGSSQGVLYSGKSQQPQQHLISQTQQGGGVEPISSSSSLSSTASSRSNLTSGSRQGIMMTGMSSAQSNSSNNSPSTAQKQKQLQGKTGATTASSPLQNPTGGGGGGSSYHPPQQHGGIQRSHMSPHQLQNAGDMMNSATPTQSSKDLQKRGGLVTPLDSQQQQILAGGGGLTQSIAFRQQQQQSAASPSSSMCVAQQQSVGGVGGGGVYTPEQQGGKISSSGTSLLSSTSNVMIPQQSMMLNHTSQPQHRDVSLMGPGGGVGGVGGVTSPQTGSYFQQVSQHPMDMQQLRRGSGSGENLKRKQSIEAVHGGGTVGGGGTPQGHEEMMLRQQQQQQFPPGRSASVEGGGVGGGPGVWTPGGVDGHQAGLASPSQPVVTGQQQMAVQQGSQQMGGGVRGQPQQQQHWGGGGGQPQAGPPPLSSIQPAPESLVEEVIKSPDILSNILNSRWSDMQEWPEEQRRQVLALQAALIRRGFVVAQ